MNMVGFRNIAVQNYRELKFEILEAIIEKYTDDFKEFTKVVWRLEES